jgi:uncharacterized membrane protein YcaP (DUF421 family)
MDSVIRGASVYLILMVILRLSGRRTLAQTTPFDFVLLLIVAETTQQALLGDDFSIINAVVLIVTLFSMDIIMSFLKEKSRKLAVFLDGSPTVLVTKGQPDWEAMRRARVDLSDILSAARSSQGLRSLDEVEFAVLEESGGISIIPAS